MEGSEDVPKVLLSSNLTHLIHIAFLIFPDGYLGGALRIAVHALAS